MTIVNNDTPLALVDQRNADGVGVATFAQQQSWRRFWEKAWCESEASECTSSPASADRHDSGQLTGSVLPKVEQDFMTDVSLKEDRTSMPSNGVRTDPHAMTLRPIPVPGPDVVGASSSVVRAAVTLPLPVPERLTQPVPVAWNGPVTPSRMIESVIQATANITRQNVNVFVEGGALQVVIRDREVTAAVITRLLPQLKRAAAQLQMLLATVIVNGECVWEGRIESM